VWWLIVIMLRRAIRAAGCGEWITYASPLASEVAMTSDSRLGTRSPNRLLGFAFGTVYVLVGLVGFAITSGVGFAADQGKDLIVFEVNPLHNIVHLAVGAVLLLAALRGAAVAKAVNSLVGGVYLLVGVVGLFVSTSSLDLLALNHPDNLLHLASAAVLLGVGRTQN
jgi:hypothetical protein